LLGTEPTPATSVAGFRAAPTQTLGESAEASKETGPFFHGPPTIGQALDPKHLPSEQRAMMAPPGGPKWLRIWQGKKWVRLERNAVVILATDSLAAIGELGSHSA
jgi:hypothetical protein